MNLKQIFFFLILVGQISIAFSQEKSTQKTRPILMTEYEKAKGFSIKDLDKETYAKFDNRYILDRYEMRKPYFITGDDGLKKRIDLYKLLAKDSMQELGTMIFYTNEKGMVYTALQPNFTADGKVWEKYFEDIHSIDKEEKNFVLKLSYILSKEMSFQLYKAINNGKDLKEEAGTYGSDICFPGTQFVQLADGTNKMLSDLKTGDRVITVDPVSKKATPVVVSKLVQHEAKNYALTKLLVVSAKETFSNNGMEVLMSGKLLEATPNHPIMTSGIRKKMSEIIIGDEVICWNEQSNTYGTFTVYNKTETAGGLQKVYNLETYAGATLIMNGVMVLQK